MATSFPYNILIDIASHKLHEARLVQEIINSGITIALDEIIRDGDDFVVSFKDDLPSESVLILHGDTENPRGGIIGNHSGESLYIPTKVILANGEESSGDKTVQVDKFGRLQAAIDKPSQPECVKASHNFCDPCTWFTKSVRETEVLLSDTGDGLTWNIPDTVNLIDMYHGRQHDELIWRKYAPEHGYEVVVEISLDGGNTWSGVVMQDPLTTLDEGEDTDNDYLVDYENGQIVFHESQAGNQVRASFSRASTDPGASIWEIIPHDNKMLSLEFAELQWSVDINPKDSVLYRVVIDSTGEGDYIDLQEPTIYHRFDQLIVESSRNSSIIQAIAPNNPRGISSDTQQGEFNYIGRKDLHSAVAELGGLGPMRLWLSLARDKAYGGGHLSVTFHFMISDDLNTQS